MRPNPNCAVQLKTKDTVNEGIIFICDNAHRQHSHLGNYLAHHILEVTALPTSTWKNPVTIFLRKNYLGSQHCCDINAAIANKSNN